MPARSLTSRVLHWPKPEAVIPAARNWAAMLAERRSDILAIGYIGSYARGDWGVGSDLDVIVIVNDTPDAFHERGVKFHSPRLPVPVDLLVYTSAEFKALRQQESRFGKMLREEVRWLFKRRTAQIPRPDSANQ